MTESSRIIPQKLKAQSESAITNLQSANDSLGVAKTALDAFINDNTNRSNRFNNMKRKMEDYKIIADAFIAANEADISDITRQT